MGPSFPRLYGTGTGADVRIPLLKRAVVDFAVGADWSPAAGDCRLSKDGGASANITTLPTALVMGNTALWVFTFSDAELQCKELQITIADAATKAVEDQLFSVLTYGHASAFWINNPTLAVPVANVTQLDGGAQSLVDLKDFADDGYDPTTNKVQGVVLVDTATVLAGHTVQTGDSFARLGAPAGASLSADVAGVKTDTGTLTTRLSSARAGYLDALNIAGVAASQADIAALNQSASRRLILTTVGQYERPESGTSTYTVELRTYDGDGAAVNADSTPTLTATGIVSGDLSAQLSAATNPATGLYRWTYTVTAAATGEQVRFDASVTIATATFTLSAYTQVVNLVAATWTTTDASNLTAVFNKLPTKLYLVGSNNTDGDIEINEATGNYPGSVGSVVADVGITQAGADKVWASTVRTLSAAGVQAIWDALTSALTTVGSIGKYLLDTLGGMGGGDTPGTTTLLTRIIGTLAAGTHTAQSGDSFARLGTNGAGLTALGDTRLVNLDATVASRATQASVDDLPTNAELTTALAAADDVVLNAIAMLLNLSSAQVQTAVEAALTAYPAATTAQVAAVTATLAAAIAALNDLSAAEAKAQLVAALTMDTYGEPGQGSPPEMASVVTKQSYIYKYLVNRKTEDGTTGKLYNYAETVVDQKAPTSEAGGVVTKGKVVSGP